MDGSIWVNETDIETIKLNQSIVETPVSIIPYFMVIVIYGSFPIPYGGVWKKS